MVGFGECSGATLMYSCFEYLVSRAAPFAILFCADLAPSVFLVGALDAIVVAPLTRPLHRTVRDELGGDADHARQMRDIFACSSIGKVNANQD
jgi:hypothetical protein